MDKKRLWSRAGLFQHCRMTTRVRRLHKPLKCSLKPGETDHAGSPRVWEVEVGAQLELKSYKAM